MGRMILAILAMGIISGAAYYALNHATRSSSASGASAPKRQLDDVRGAASRMEAEADQRARDLEEKMGGGE